MNDQQQAPPFLPHIAEGVVPTVGYIGINTYYEFMDHFETYVVDDSFEDSTDLDGLIEAQPSIVFISEPAKTAKSGRIDAKEIENAILKLVRNTRSAIVVRSSLTPDIWNRLLLTVKNVDDLSRILYYPDMSRTSMELTVIGGMESSVNTFLQFMDDCSDFEPLTPGKVKCLNPVELSYLEYTIYAIDTMKEETIDKMIVSTKEDLPGCCNYFKMRKLIVNDSGFGSYKSEEEKVRWMAGFTPRFGLFDTLDDNTQKEEGTE
jgi:hypothetical protein